jgi:DNA-binding CsgD family transcriptional regulator
MSINQPALSEPVRRHISATSAAPIERRLLLCDITRRQLQCLAWVEQGKSSSDIGGILGVSYKTVDKHVLKICAALGVKSRFQAAQKAREIGLFTAIEGSKITPRSWVALPLSANEDLCQS